MCTVWWFNRENLSTVVIQVYCNIISASMWSRDIAWSQTSDSTANVKWGVPCTLSTGLQLLVPGTTYTNISSSYRRLRLTCSSCEYLLYGHTIEQFDLEGGSICLSTPVAITRFAISTASCKLPWGETKPPRSRALQGLQLHQEGKITIKQQTQPVNWRNSPTADDSKTRCMNQYLFGNLGPHMRKPLGRAHWDHDVGRYLIIEEIPQIIRTLSWRTQHLWPQTKRSACLTIDHFSRDSEQEDKVYKTIQVAVEGCLSFFFKFLYSANSTVVKL